MGASTETQDIHTSTEYLSFKVLLVSNYVLTLLAFIKYWLNASKGAIP